MPSVQVRRGLEYASAAVAPGTCSVASMNHVYRVPRLETAFVLCFSQTLLLVWMADTFGVTHKLQTCHARAPGRVLARRPGVTARFLSKPDQHQARSLPPVARHDHVRGESRPEASALRTSLDLESFHVVIMRAKHILV